MPEGALPLADLFRGEMSQGAIQGIPGWLAAMGASPPYSAPSYSGASILLGVMSSPKNARMRAQWREWAGGFTEAGRSGVDVRFVVGKRFFYDETVKITRPVLTPPARVLMAENATHNDFLWIDGREGLPHVGKVTEKSAAWWLTVAHDYPGYSYYCKSDDDTLVHLDRLRAVLHHVQRSRGPNASVYFGHIKWRGWDVGTTGTRFQACGGGWGAANKTGEDIARGGTMPPGSKTPTYPPCPHAAGPYPYMSGGMVCMSRRMAKLLQQSQDFWDFFGWAKRRNTEGEPCDRPKNCAAQPADSHMWHHEDAGIGFNVFRAVVAANATLAVVPVPAHYNDPGIVEKTESAQDNYWSSRAVFVHGIKSRKGFEAARSRWTLKRPDAYWSLRCAPCTAPGTNAHNGDWQRARLPCVGAWAGKGAVPPGGEVEMCPVNVSAHFTCCGWPWLVPELRALLLDALRDGGGSLPSNALHRAMQRRLKAAQRKEPKRCVRDCLNLKLPTGGSFRSVLLQLQERGDLVLSNAAELAELDGKRPNPTVTLAGGARANQTYGPNG